MVLVSHQRGSRKTTVDKLGGQPLLLSLSPPSPTSWLSNYSLSPPTQATKIELISHYVQHHSCWGGPVRVTRQRADMSNLRAWDWLWAAAQGYRCDPVLHFPKQSRHAVVTPFCPRTAAWPQSEKAEREGASPTRPHTLLALLTCVWSVWVFKGLWYDVRVTMEWDEVKSVSFTLMSQVRIIPSCIPWVDIIYFH